MNRNPYLEPGLVRILFLPIGLLVLSFKLVAQPVEEKAVQPSVDLPAELDRVLRDYERAWGEHDAKALSELFASEGFVLSPGSAPVRGRADIEAVYREYGGPLYLRALSFERSDSIAYIIGEYRFRPEDSDVGKFILTLRSGPDGQWLITADMNNGNSQ